MTGTDSHGPRPSSPAPDDAFDQAWISLEHGLAQYLTVLGDPDDEDHLVVELSVAVDGGCAPYVQFASSGGGTRVRAEIVGDVHLSPAHRLGPHGAWFLLDRGWCGNDDAEPNWFCELDAHDPVAFAGLAADLVQVLRTHFCLPHPQLLVCTAWGPAADHASVLGLLPAADVPQEAGPTASGGVAPTDPDHLAELVRAALAARLGYEPEIDDDGDVVLRHDGRRVWVRVRPEQPAVEVVCRVVEGVRSRRATLVELGLVNRDRPWSQWVLLDRAVWQRQLIPAMPFVPQHLDSMLTVFLDGFSATRDDLVMRTGGRG